MEGKDEDFEIAASIATQIVNIINGTGCLDAANAINLIMTALIETAPSQEHREMIFAILFHGINTSKLAFAIDMTKVDAILKIHYEENKKLNTHH